MTISRREFLGTVAAAALVGCSRKAEPFPQGGFVDDGGARGHRLRDPAGFGAPVRRVRVPVVVVGGGIAGLSAAWQMQRHGFGDFVVLEMEDEAGGNARAGVNDVSAFPWAAHYVPVPGPQATLARELFADLGVLRDDVWDERHLCFSPHERLFFGGTWHEGLESAALGPVERAEMARFFERVGELRESGEFTIPSALGRRASSLDSVSMAAWMEREGFRSPSVRWYADYGCRDDYGAPLADTSAWAGLHYFAAREPQETGPLTWPEGNAWIVRQLLERMGDRVVTGAMVHRVERSGSGVRVLAGDTEYQADAVVWAAPSFLAQRLVEGAPRVDFTYSPWLVANLTLDRVPESGFGAELAWDNVLLDSPSLGYVDATHQSLRTHKERTVWTYYWALTDRSPGDARRLLLSRSWRDWTEAILADLSRAHPDLRRCLRRVDVMRQGHAMIRPTPGFLSSPARQALAAADGPVFYAHSDLSGLSLFEEAQYHGVAAADRVLARVGG